MRGRFQAIHLAGWHPSAEDAGALDVDMERFASAPDEEYCKETSEVLPSTSSSGRPRGRLHAGFIKIAEDEGFSPARGIISR
jgi:hypothetical protein